MIARHASLLLLNILLSITTPAAQNASPSKVPPPEILGVRLGTPYATAHSQLAKLGQLQKEAEGQEVWTLLGDEHYQFLIVGFDAERRVRYVTAIADAGGTPLRFEDIGDLGRATRTGQPGNLTLTWKADDPKSKIEYVAIAKGKDVQRLSSLSVKRLGAKAEED